LIHTNTYKKVFKDHAVSAEISDFAKTSISHRGSADFDSGIGYEVKDVRTDYADEQNFG
jgi:hypothetical protein